MEDIVNNNLFVGTSDKYYESMVENSPEFFNYSEELFLDCSVNFTCWKRIRNSRDVAVLVGVQSNRSLKKTYTNKITGSSFMKELKRSFFTIKYVLLLNRGHPFFHELNSHVQYLIESGISEKINKKYENPYWDLPTKEPIQVLKLEHIVSPFMILAVGLMLSIIVFLFELRNWQFITRRNRWV
ncbi:hypothetical protein WA026_007665 [Henosepilachna vigintioctopunctata]|uniref:Uncharacterized protein n=1 Tax=Henosepilachna vigintioctopunctata TaxID=420089 RepID=A0AAW1U3Q8_9CUCU